METLTNTIDIEDLDALARLLLGDAALESTYEPGDATALAYKAGKLTIKGLLAENPAIQAILNTTEQAA